MSQRNRRKRGTRPTGLVRLAVFVEPELRSRTKFAASKAAVTMELWVADAILTKLYQAQKQETS